MPLPGNFNTVPVTGKWVNLDGSPAIGSVSFTASLAPGNFLKDAGADVTILPMTISVPLDGTGSLSISLPATDDPDIYPNGWTYTVLENFATGNRSYSIQVPQASGGVDLVTVAPVGSATASVQLVTWDRVGQANGVASLDSNGRLPAAQVSNPLTLASDPTASLGAATKQYTDRSIHLAPSSKPRPFRAASWSQLFQAGHGAVGFNSGVASTNPNDTTTFCRGTQSFQMVTTGTGAVASIRKTGGTIPDLTGKAIRLTFRVADVTQVNQINFQVGSSTLVNTFSWRVFTYASTAQNMVQSGEWVTVTLSWADIKSATGSYSINANGTPSTKSGFTDFQLQVSDNATASATINLQSVEVIPDTTTTFPNGVVSITFDDSYGSPFTYARPKMDTLGFRGTCYNIIDSLGVGSSLTVPQLRLLQDMSGWEMAGHSYTLANHNAKYTTLPTQTVVDELRQCRQWLVDNGFHSDHFGYPGGWFGPSTNGDPIDILAQQYWASGRGVSSADNLELFPPSNPFRMRSVTGIGALAGGSSPALPANLVATGGPLDRCQLSGNWLILTWHDIVTGSVTTSNQCSQTDFNTIMDAINARGIPVVPVGEVMRNYG